MRVSEGDRRGAANRAERRECARATTPTSVSGTGLCGTGRTTLSRGSGSVRRDGRLVSGAGADAGGCGVALAGGGQMRGGCRQAEDRHVAVDGLVFPGLDPERLVPDPDVSRGPDGTVEPP